MISLSLGRHRLADGAARKRNKTYRLKYTKRSFHFSVISIVLMAVFLVLSTIERTKDNTAMNDVTAFLITLFMISVVTGFVFALLSFRESYSIKKAFSLIVNVGLFLFLGYYVMQNLVAM